MEELKIGPAIQTDVDILAEIIRTANQTVAEELLLSPENCPKHPSNCTSEWIQDDMDRGVTYFQARLKTRVVGCVAMDVPDPNPENGVYLERLAVLPEFRHNGYGAKLVSYCIDKAIQKDFKKVGIGIIDEQTVLKEWYKRFGFQMTGTKTFIHLPFTVGFMEKLF